MVATAMVHGMPIVTKDERMRACKGVRAIW
jgi:PIN domain nuclease of toxin-antitoxin system